MSGTSPEVRSRRDFMVASALSAGAVGAGVVAAGALADDKSEPTGADTSGTEGTSGAKSNKAAAGQPLAPPDRQSHDAKMPTPVKKKIGWAIVGLGKLALEEILPAFGMAEYSRAVALVSGHSDKAKRVAQKFGIDQKNIYDYENYDDLAKNTEVDAIYIVLPNSMHAEFTIRGFAAGKHVLCEKPMAVSSKECEQMIAAANKADRKLMIAYRLHYEPFNSKVIELCSNKELGTIKTFYGSNGQDVAAPNIRLSKKLGGGPVGDVGVYCINAARYATGEEPTEVSAMAFSPSDDARFREVPESVAFTLRFPSGVLAHCDCSFGSAQNRQYRVVCEKGTIDMDPAFSYFGLQLRLNDGDGPQELQLKPNNHFAAEMDHFAQCILEGQQPRTPGEEGLADMRVIEAIAEAARTGTTVKIDGSKS